MTRCTGTMGNHHRLRVWGGISSHQSKGLQWDGTCPPRLTAQGWGKCLILRHSQDPFGDLLGKNHLTVNFPTGHQFHSPPSSERSLPWPSSILNLNFPSVGIIGMCPCTGLYNLTSGTEDKGRTVNAHPKNTWLYRLWG